MTKQPICKKCKGTGTIFRRFIPSSTGVDEMRPCPDCQPEQPNTELLIVKTIQGLMSAANNQLRGLEVIETTSTTNEKLRLVRKALEDIDLFEKTTLFELQKAFE